MPIASPDSVFIEIGNGGTGQTTAQAAIDALTQVACATNEHVLTKDTCTGNAVWKAAGGGGGICEVVCDTTPTLGGQLDANANNIINVGYFESNAGTPATLGAIRLGLIEGIAWSNTNNQIRFDTGNRFEIRPSNVNEYDFDATQANWKGNNLINVGYLESNATNPSSSGIVRIGSTESLAWRNNANNGDVLLAKDTNDKLTFDGHIADPVGIHDMPVPASAMWAGTTEGATGLTSTEFGAAGHKITLQTWDFTSTAADERVQFRTPLPREYDNGTIDIQINWSFASGSGDVRWGARMVATGDNEAIATNFGTAVEANDTAGTADQVQQTTLSTITIGNTPADTNEIHFEIYREGSDAGDTFSGTARLHSVVVRFTTDSAVSA